MTDSCACTMDSASPQSALKNLDCMHNYLQKRLQSVNDPSDLIPYMQVLMPLNHLKIQLSSLLHQQYTSQSQTQPNQATNDCETYHVEGRDKIRSLYIRLCSLNGIPNDVLHAKIISFLPSTEYKKLPMLSTHFRNIMRTYPFIYNHKKYSVQLLLKNRALTKSSNHTQICVMHNTQKVMIKPWTKQRHHKHMNRASTVSFPFHDVHIYKIYCESVCDWLYVGSEYRNLSDDEEQSDTLRYNTSNLANYFDEPTTANDTSAVATDNTDSYNDSSIELLSKSHAAIKYLCIENVQLLLQQKIFNPQHKFTQCIVLNIRDSPTYDNILNTVTDATFGKLQYLEIWYPKQSKLHQNTLMCADLLDRDPAKLCSILDDRQLDQFYAHIALKKVLCDAMNNILRHCASTLIAFVYHDENEREILNWGWCALMLEHLKNNITYKGVLSIPSHIEFLSLRNSSFCTDLSTCQRLIAMEILGDTHYTEIKWPKGYVVPYAYLSPPKTMHSMKHNQWKHMVIGEDGNECHMPSTRFICLGKRISRSTPSLKFSWDPELDDLNEIVDSDASDQLQRYKMNDVMIREAQNIYLPHRCLLLDKSEMNDGLFGKIMYYKFRKEYVRRNKIAMYRNWWDLGAGIWIK
eukprot:438709_1